MILSNPERGLSLEQFINIDLGLKEEIVALDRLIFGESGLSLWVLSPLLRYGIVLGLREKANLVGIAEFLKDWNDHSCAYMFGFGIHPAARGRGYGKWFLDACIECLSGFGVKIIQLTVSPDNIPAVRLYKKAGFQKIEELASEYGLKEDRWLMRCCRAGAGNNIHHGD